MKKEKINAWVYAVEKYLRGETALEEMPECTCDYRGKMMKEVREKIEGMKKKYFVFECSGAHGGVLRLSVKTIIVRPRML